MTHIHVLVLAWWLQLGAIAPLSPQQVERLAGAVDGADHREDAFPALIENVRQWSTELGDEPIRLNPDFNALLTQPSTFRGDLCRINGKLQQQTRLAPPYETIWEWFVRAQNNQPIVVYVVDLDPSTSYPDNQQVEIDARFYKRVDFTARDGKHRRYPAFVGACPRIVWLRGHSQPYPELNRLWMVAVPAGAMLVVFTFLLLYVRRKRSQPEPLLRAQHAASRPAGGLSMMDESLSLPHDPAEALAELKRRADDR